MARQLIHLADPFTTAGHFLAATGFGFRYRADGVTVYRALVR